MSKDTGPSKYNPYYWIFNSTPAQQPTVPAQQTEATQPTATPMQTDDSMDVESNMANLAAQAVDGTQQQATAPVTQPEQTLALEPVAKKPSLLRRGFNGLNYAKDGTLSFAKNNAYELGAATVATGGVMVYDYLQQQTPVAPIVITAATLLTELTAASSFIGLSQAAKLAKKGISKGLQALRSKKRKADDAELTPATTLQDQVQKGIVPEVTETPVDTTTTTVPTVDAAITAPVVPTVDAALADLAAQALNGVEQQATQPALNLEEVAQMAVQSTPTFTFTAPTAIDASTAAIEAPVVAEEEASTNKRQKRTKKADVSGKEDSAEEVEIVVEEKKKPVRRSSRRGRGRRNG